VFWVGIFFFIVALLALFSIPIAAQRGVAVSVGIIAALVGALSWTIGSYNRVPTRNVGIVTSFSKPTGEITGAGVHWTKPWQDIDDWDATRQSFNHLGDNCLWVQIAGQRNMCVRVQINWETTTAERAALNWSTYPEKDGHSRFEQFVSRQVEPLFNDSLLATFRDFDPMSLVDAKTGEMTAPDLAGAYTPKLQAAIASRLGQDIEVKSISWGLVAYDQATTALISQRGQKVLESRNLEIDEKNAAARERIAGKSGVPAAVQQCLDLVKLQGKGEPGLCLSGSVALTRPIS
jgi:regulator of protease activity HflC (stomatin/prohibitin superfamily)